MLLLFLALVSPVFSVFNCYQCATPGLLNNWQLTGYPAPPKLMKYASNCASSSQLPTTSGIVDTACTSSCVEMTIPTSSGTYEVLRGCHDEMKGGADLPAPTVTEDKPTCTHANLTTGYNAVRFCVTAPDTPAAGNDPAQATPPCNDVLTATATVTIKAGNTYNCPAYTGEVDCISCSSFDGKGKCSSGEKKSTAKGPYCVKIRGKFSGHDYEERGPALLLPSSKVPDGSIDISYSVTSNLGGSSGPNVERSKRSITQYFSGTKSYCTTAMCNSSPMVAGLPATLLLIVTALPFFS